MPTYCLDYQPGVAQGAGIGRYTRELAKNLPALLTPDERLRLFYCDFHRRTSGNPVPAAEARACRWIPGTVLQKAWHWLGAPAFDCFSGPADLFHFTNFCTRPVRAGRSVVSVHDMSFERFPQFAEEKNLRYLHRGVARSVERSDAIITISEFSKREIEALLPAARGKVHVTYLGIDPDFAPAPADRIAAVRKTLGLERPFLLSVGTIEPRKNLGFLVDAWEKLAPEGIDLVLAGAPGWRCEPIFARFEASPFRDRLHYVRRVPDGTLADLYSAASLYVTPSHYEGFGFPPLEAMACGTPVLSSDGGSLPEVLGDAASVLHGFDADAWAHEARRLLSLEGADRDSLVRRGREQAARFRWEDTVRATLAVYREVLAR